MSRKCDELIKQGLYPYDFSPTNLRLTDGRTDDGEFNSPPSSLREVGDNDSQKRVSSSYIDHYCVRGGV